MNNISTISERVNIQSVAKHFLYGKDPYLTSGKSYEGRNDDALMSLQRKFQSCTWKSGSKWGCVWH